MRAWQRLRKRVGTTMKKNLTRLQWGHLMPAKQTGTALFVCSVPLAWEISEFFPVHEKLFLVFFLFLFVRVYYASGGHLSMNDLVVRRGRKNWHRPTTSLLFLLFCLWLAFFSFRATLFVSRKLRNARGGKKQKFELFPFVSWRERDLVSPTVQS